MTVYWRLIRCKFVYSLTCLTLSTTWIRFVFRPWLPIHFVSSVTKWKSVKGSNFLFLSEESHRPVVNFNNILRAVFWHHSFDKDIQSHTVRGCYVKICDTKRGVRENVTSSQSYKTFFLRFPFSIVRLGHFTINDFFLFATNTQAYKWKMEKFFEKKFYKIGYSYFFDFLN